MSLFFRSEWIIIVKHTFVVVAVVVVVVIRRWSNFFLSMEYIHTYNVSRFDSLPKACGHIH